jgi:hypothetical protein
MRFYRDEQWVCTDSARKALKAQGYIVHWHERRHGVKWTLMVLPWEQV